MTAKKPSTSRRTFVKGTAASAAIAPFFIGRSAKAGEVTHTLRVATVAPKPTPWGKLASGLSSEVKERSGGAVKMKIHYGGQLGPEQAMAEATGSGTNDVYAGSVGGMAKIVPELSALELPYIVSSPKQGQKVLEANRTLIHDILWEKGFKLMLFSENGTQDIGATRPIEKPSDMKGLKMRSLQSQVHIDTIEATGASAMPMGVTEVLPSLKTGVIDGFTNTALFATAAGWSSGITNWTVSQHCYQPAVVVMSRLVWERLPSEIQEAMGVDSDELKKLESRTFRRLHAMVKQLQQNISDLGITVHEPDLAPWRKMAAGVHSKFRKRTSKQGVALLKGIKKAT